jgi:hypothetical protein
LLALEESSESLEHPLTASDKLKSKKANFACFRFTKNPPIRKLSPISSQTHGSQGAIVNSPADLQRILRWRNFAHRASAVRCFAADADRALCFGKGVER